MKLAHEKERYKDKYKLSVKDQKQCNVGSNLQLLPKFSERDPGLFLSLFERVADTRGWPDGEHTLLLQCVLTGKAQETYVFSHLQRARNMR